MGSGVKSLEIAQDAALRGRIWRDPKRQLVATSTMFGRASIRQARVLDGLPVCTDLNTKTWLSEARVPVIEQRFYAKLTSRQAVSDARWGRGTLSPGN
jgi:hypothetical protein